MRSLAKNYLYNVISLLTGVLFPFVTFPYVSRILMPEYLGKISFVQSLTNYFITLSLLGVPIYGIRELSRAKISKNYNEFSKKFTELLLISLITSIISFVLFMILIMLSQKMNEIKNLLYIYSFQIVFAFLNLDYLFIVLEKHKRRTIRTVILRIISLVLIFIFVKEPKDYQIYGIILVFPELLARIVDIYLCKEYMSLNLKKLNFKIHFKSLLTIFLYIFSVGVYLNLDITMIGFMKTELEVGLYTTGSKLVKMVIPVMSVLGTVMAPKIIGYIKNEEKEKIFENIDKFIDFNIFIGVPATFLMIYLSKDIILLIAGEYFIDSTLTMKIISIIIVFLPIGTFFGGQILLPNDKENLIFKIAIIGMICNIFLNCLLIPKFSIEGAAIATVFTEIMIFLYRGYEVKKIYKEYIFITKERINYILVGFIAFISIFLLKNMKKENIIYNIIFFSTFYSIIYLSGLILLKDKNMIYILKKIKLKK